MIALLAALALQAGSAVGGTTSDEARAVVNGSEEICPELMRHPEGWNATPYMRAAAEARGYTAEQYLLLLGLCRRYVDGWSAALADHERRRARR